MKNENNKISSHDFTQVIISLLREDLVAFCQEKNGKTIEIRFINGQKFRLCIDEIQ